MACCYAYNDSIGCVLQVGVRALDELHHVQNDVGNRLRHRYRFLCPIEIRELEFDHFVLIIVHSSERVVVIF